MKEKGILSTSCLMSNSLNESPAHQPNELPLSPSAYYDSIPLTAQLPLDVAREVLREATIHHEEEPLPVLLRTGLNVLQNSECTTSDAVEVAEGFAATIKNRESFHQLRILLLQTQITQLQCQVEQQSKDNTQPDDDHPRFMAAPVGFSLNTGHLPNVTLPSGRNGGQLAKWVRRLPDGRALLYAEDDGPGDQPYAVELFAELDISDETPAQSLPRWLLDALTNPSAAFHTVRSAAEATLDWGLQAELLCYRDLDQRAKALNDSISNLEAEVSGVLAEQRLALGRLEGARAATLFGHLRLGARGPRKSGRGGWRHPDTRVSWGNKRGRSG